MNQSLLGHQNSSDARLQICFVHLDKIIPAGETSGFVFSFVNRAIMQVKCYDKINTFVTRLGSGGVTIGQSYMMFYCLSQFDHRKDLDGQ